MNRIPELLCAVLVAVCLSFSCASDAGQLRADNMAPLVDVVTQDLEEYLDAGLAPDGTALSAAEVDRKRGGCIILRNAVATAQGGEREPLPTFAPTTAGVGGPEPVPNGTRIEEAPAR